MGAHDEAKLDTKFIDFAKQMNLYLNLYTFAKAVKDGKKEAIASCLGHALRTGSYRHMKNMLKEIYEQAA